MAGFEIDTSQARALAADIGRASGRAIPKVEAVLKKGAQSLKESMAAEFAKSWHFKRVAPAVTYERQGFGRSIVYEIGPEVGRGRGSGGGLGGIAVDGGANGGGGTVRIDHLLDSEAAAVERYLGDVLDGAL